MSSFVRTWSNASKESSGRVGDTLGGPYFDRSKREEGSVASTDSDVSSIAPSSTVSRRSSLTSVAASSTSSPRKVNLEYAGLDAKLERHSSLVNSDDSGIRSPTSSIPEEIALEHSREGFEFHSEGSIQSRPTSAPDVFEKQVASRRTVKVPVQVQLGTNPNSEGNVTEASNGRVPGSRSRLSSYAGNVSRGRRRFTRPRGRHKSWSTKTADSAGTDSSSNHQLGRNGGDTSARSVVSTSTRWSQPLSNASSLWHDVSRYLGNPIRPPRDDRKESSLKADSTAANFKFDGVSGAPCNVQLASSTHLSWLNPCGRVGSRRKKLRAMRSRPTSRNRANASALSECVADPVGSSSHDRSNALEVKPSDITDPPRESFYNMGELSMPPGVSPGAAGEFTQLRYSNCNCKPRCFRRYYPQEQKGE
ncbi:hypothetical protein QFC19_003756 [Naganishia cerealis]|uniref:Uncharacterized protein n=1 Tax=Naganishia cerealis TaxID=610337 RepID=A0ACC2W0W8_9TREE|nr:hypothetical protein QFC19_003756 [Naganishia cerealis]